MISFALQLKNVIEVKEITIDKRNAIIKTATKLFGERGFEDVSTRDIAKNADVNVALISYYFKSKEGLFDAIVDERMSIFGERISEIKKMDLTAWQRVTIVFDEYCNKMMSNPDFSRMVYRQITYLQRAPTTIKILDEISKNRNSILEIFEEGKRNGEFNLDTDYKFLILTFMCTLSSIVKSPVMAVQILNLESEKELFTKKFIEKLKSFFKDFFFRYTLIEK